MGQDGEEAAEMIATIRGEHVAMKTWYQGPSAQAEAVRAKYGPYPGLWKEVINWPGWKEARKAYLQFTQTKGSSSSGPSVPRKRRSRWGSADDGDENAEKKRRSRWGREESNTPAQPAIPGLPLPGMGGGGLLPGMPSNLTPEQQAKMRDLQSRLRTINDRMNNLEAEAARVDALPRGHRERSPSPPPIYGADGKRKNTRAVRWRERYTAERLDVLEQIMSLNPATRQSGHMLKRKRTHKIPIPVEQHPTYNFIGLIIGPRGKTQKDLEAKTGCKIAIRGRGSVKEGARGRRDGKIMEGDDEPLHVVITGDDQRSVDAATDMINQMLVVIDDEVNVHKQQQLRELALLNGTLKEDEYCQICAEKGHRSFECPRRFSMNKPTISVKCAICGDTSHPTRDCTQKPTEQKDAKQLDSDYMSFMAELDGKKVDKPATPAGVVPNPANGSPAEVPTGATGTPISTGITIIKPADKVAAPPSATGGDTALPPPPTGLPPPPSSAPGTLPPPPPPNSGLPPPPGPPPSLGSTEGLPPPPPQGQVAVPPTGLPPAPSAQGVPPPPSSLPPPPNAYAPPPQGGYNYGNQQAYNAHHQQPPPNYQQQQPQQVDVTQAWDYRSYYGSSATGGDAGGAGGFNWWEQS